MQLKSSMHFSSSTRLGGFGAAASHQLPRRFPPARNRIRQLRRVSSKGDNVPDSVKQRLEFAAASGKGLSAEEVQELLQVAKKGEKKKQKQKKKKKESTVFSGVDDDPKRFLKFPEGLSIKDVEIPERMKNVLKDLKLWDLIPPEGMRVAPEPDEEDGSESAIWTKQEYEILTDEDYEGTEEEEARREVIKFMAIKKLETALSTHHTDPEKILNMGFRAKRGLKDDEFYIDLADYDDSRFPEKKEKDPEIEEFLKTLAQGKQIPHASTWNKNLLPPEDADSFMKRMQLFQDYQHDIKAKRKDRRLPDEQFKAIKERWKQFSREYDEVHDNVFQEDVNVSQEAPMWPEWQENQHRIAQHMYYLLRTGHIEGTVTEPARRLKKYDLIADDVEFSVSSVFQAKGYDEYINHMFKLRSSGVTSEASELFLTVTPPKGERSEDNPNDYEIVCDFFCYVPLPEWYQDMIKEQERKMEEKRKKAPLGLTWQNPLDVSEYAEAWNDQSNLMLLQYMDGAVKSPDMSSQCTSPAATWEIGDEDPYPDEGPVWQPDDANGNAWKTGDVFSINSTVKYFVDIKAGKIHKIEVGWGGMIGSINTMKDGEKMYRLAAGLDPTVTTGDYRSFQSLIYDAFFKNPVEWIKETIMKPMALKKLQG